MSVSHCVKPEVLVGRLPHHQPPLVIQVEHPLGLLLPPLLPLVVDRVPYGDIAVHVLPRLVVTTDAIFLEMRCHRHPILIVETDDLRIDPLDVLKPVPIERRRKVPIIWEPGQLGCIEQCGHCKSIRCGRVEMLRLLQYSVLEQVQLPHHHLFGGPLGNVIEPCHHQNINTSDLLAILNSECLLQGVDLTTRNGHVVGVQDVPPILDLVVCTVWGSPEHVESRAGHTQLDSLCGERSVHTLTRGAVIVPILVLGQVHHEVGGEMPVGHCCRFL